MSCVSFREESMREMALRLSLEDENKRKTDRSITHERSIIIIGSKGVGKTTMVYRFLEKEESPKATIAMDYSFGRKAGKSLVKDVVHVWEVGPLTSSLLSAAMTGSALTHSPHHTTLLMMLDLSKPEELWATLEECLTIARSAMRMSFDDNAIKALRDCRKRENNPKNETYEGETEPFPLKLCIVGGRYDEFKEFNSDRKQLIGRALRAAAHALGAGLHYHSCRDTSLVRRAKDMLSHYGFGSQLTKGVCIDYEKPLLVPVGLDSFTQIGLNFGQGRNAHILESIKQMYVTHIPQTTKENENPQDLEDPANDPNFREPIIDRLRAQREEVKRKEIGILLQEMLEGRALKIPIPEPM
ncbi:cytoplasmic dynein 2 light intermediate chain 1 isoform X1 [Neodiprion lecontei]|uniref:Cytoplasmic dynein 2 light intermediate chain 1 n=2 Tax=Neodiprion lecontei TaxID=441921 RepID=A0ABM3FGF8_NEOLC|nr:cytoplasmic dynein 2 light intermediate chain 1 isoform X1 [Neodiprion lecontei]